MMNMAVLLVLFIALERRRRRRGNKRMRLVDGHSRRSFRGLEAANDEFINAMTTMMTAMTEMLQGLGDLIERLVDRFKLLADEAEARKKLFFEIEKIEGFTKMERIKATAHKCADRKASYFLSLPDEHKKAYIQGVLAGCQ